MPIQFENYDALTNHLIPEWHDYIQKTIAITKNPSLNIPMSFIPNENEYIQVFFNSSQTSPSLLKSIKQEFIEFISTFQKNLNTTLKTSILLRYQPLKQQLSIENIPEELNLKVLLDDIAKQKRIAQMQKQNLNTLNIVDTEITIQTLITRGTITGDILNVKAYALLLSHWCTKNKNFILMTDNGQQLCQTVIDLYSSDDNSGITLIHYFQGSKHFQAIKIEKSADNVHMIIMDSIGEQGRTNFCLETVKLLSKLPPELKKNMYIYQNIQLRQKPFTNHCGIIAYKDSHELARSVNLHAELANIAPLEPRKNIYSLNIFAYVVPARFMVICQDSDKTLEYIKKYPSHSETNVNINKLCSAETLFAKRIRIKEKSDMFKEHSDEKYVLSQRYKYLGWTQQQLANQPQDDIKAAISRSAAVNKLSCC